MKFKCGKFKESMERMGGGFGSFFTTNLTFRENIKDSIEKKITKDTQLVHIDLIFTINNINIVDSNLR